MKIAIRETYGPPEVLEIREAEKPLPGAEEVLVRVHATTVNRTDCANLSATPFFMRLVTGLLKPKFPVPGTDFAGVIEAVGENVRSFQAGDRVFGFNDLGLSSQAEYLTVPESEAMAIMPDNVSFEQAAASLEGAHYAINFINKVPLQKGQRVLVHGSSGAIGSATAQLAKYHGAFVTAVGNTRVLEIMSSLGMDEVIDCTKEDFTRLGRTYDYVFDAVGKSTFGKCKGLLEAKGVYMSSELGPFAQNLFLPGLTRLFGGKIVKFPLPVDREASIALVKELLIKEKFKPVIDREYPLDRIVDAYRYVASGQKTGNVILKLI